MPESRVSLQPTRMTATPPASLASRSCSFSRQHGWRAIVADAVLALLDLDLCRPHNSDQKAGVDIVRRAIQVPARQIVENAGEDGSVIVGRLLENSKYNWGFNAATGEYQDLVAAGVIDPAKVVRIALQAASSVAGLLITTEAMVAEFPKKTLRSPKRPGAWTTRQRVDAKGAGLRSTSGPPFPVGSSTCWRKLRNRFISVVPDYNYGCGQMASRSATILSWFPRSAP